MPQDPLVLLVRQVQLVLHQLLQDQQERQAQQELQDQLVQVDLLVQSVLLDNKDLAVQQV